MTPSTTPSNWRPLKKNSRRKLVCGRSASPSRLRKPKVYWRLAPWSNTPSPAGTMKASSKSNADSMSSISCGNRWLTGGLGVTCRAFPRKSFLVKESSLLRSEGWCSNALLGRSPSIITWSIRLSSRYLPGMNPVRSRSCWASCPTNRLCRFYRSIVRFSIPSMKMSRNKMLTRPRIRSMHFRTFWLKFSNRWSLTSKLWNKLRSTTRMRINTICKWFTHWLNSSKRP